MEDMLCKNCSNILDEAVELPCKHCICLSCTIGLLEANLQSIPCPDCEKLHNIATTSFSTPSPLTLKVLGQLVVRCERNDCNKAVYLKDLLVHLASNCTAETHNIRHSVTLDQILDQSTDAPPTQLEMETAGHVICRKVLQSQSPFNLPTGGCVSIIECTSDNCTGTHTH